MISLIIKLLELKFMKWYLLKAKYLVENEKSGVVRLVKLWCLLRLFYLFSLLSLLFGTNCGHYKNVKLKWEFPVQFWCDNLYEKLPSPLQTVWDVVLNDIRLILWVYKWFLNLIVNILIWIYESIELWKKLTWSDWVWGLRLLYIYYYEDIYRWVVLSLIFFYSYTTLVLLIKYFSKFFW